STRSSSFLSSARTAASATAPTTNAKPNRKWFMAACHQEVNERSKGADSGHRAARHRTAAEWDAGGRQRHGRGLDGPRRQVEPLPFTVAHAGHPDPVEDPRLVPAFFHHDRGRGTVHEVQTALNAVAFDVKA